MKASGILVVVASVAAAAPSAAADPVVDAFYNRCVSENAYQMAPNELEGACACMAPVMVSSLTDDAHRRVSEAIKNNAPVSLGASPFKGNPADLARTAIKQCPGVGKALDAPNCAGGDETAPQCQDV